MRECIHWATAIKNAPTLAKSTLNLLKVPENHALETVNLGFPSACVGGKLLLRQAGGQCPFYKCECQITVTAETGTDHLAVREQTTRDARRKRLLAHTRFTTRRPSFREASPEEFQNMYRFVRLTCIFKLLILWLGHCDNHVKNTAAFCFCAFPQVD